MIDRRRSRPREALRGSALVVALGLAVCLVALLLAALLVIVLGDAIEGPQAGAQVTTAAPMSSSTVPEVGP